MELREAPKVGEIAKKVQDREAELVRAYDEKRRPLPVPTWEEDGGNGSTIK